MDEPDYTRVLDQLYQDQQVLSEGPGDRDLTAELMQTSALEDLDEGEIRSAVQFMRRSELLNYREIEGTAFYMGLSELGFKVAHDRTMKKRHYRSDLLLVAFTAIVASTAFVQGVYSLLGLRGVWRFGLLAVLIVGIGVSVFLIVSAFRTGR